MDKILTHENNKKIITNLIELIEKFSLIIYQSGNNESYGLLIKIIDILDSIVGEKSSLILEKKFEIYIKKLTDKFPDLLDAFENNDNVLISDILKYEIKPILKVFV